MTDWRKEMEKHTTKSYELRLLRDGPKSFNEALVLGTLKKRYDRMMGLKDPEPPNCQSSFKDFSQNNDSL